MTRFWAHLKAQAERKVGLPLGELPFTLHHGDLSGVDFCLEFCHDFCHTFLIGPGPLAQSVEQRTFNPWVDGSSPSGPTTLLYLWGKTDDR